MIKKLKYVKPGELFKFAGVEWIKLEDARPGIKCIAADKVADIAFDAEDRNNWKESTLRKYLHNDFYNYLKKSGMHPEDLLPIVSDLTSDDGLKNYGTSEDTIALITCDDYRKYRSLIPAINSWWWTITSRSSNQSYSSSVRVVYTSGALSSYSACDRSCSVRPLIKLWQETEVELKETELEKLSLDSLTKKIKHWAVDRELNNADPKGQTVKLLEEAGELAEGIAKGRPDQVKDSIGDVYVVLTILALQLDLDIKECIKTAYDEIKDRKGRMVHGVYVKEEDLKNE